MTTEGLEWGHFDADLPDDFLATLRDMPTPFYAIDVRRVTRRARAFRKGMENVFPDGSTAYPFKVNPIAEVSRAVLDVYGAAEVSTAEEFVLATAQGCPAPQCFLGGVGTSDDLLARALAEGATLKVDSSAEMRRLDALWGTVTVHDEFRILLRVSLPGEHRWSRFGLVPDELADALASPAGWARRVRGVHFHVGTNIPDSALFAAASRQCVPFLREIGLRGDRLPVLDVGGGFPNCADGDAARIAESYLSAIAVELEANDLPRRDVELVCEPGRITVERAGYLVASVLETRDRDGDCAVVVDAGCTLAGGSWSTVRAGRAAVVVGDPSLLDARPDIHGNLCFEEDVIAERAVVAPGAPGDKIAVIGDVGGYRLAAAAVWMQKIPPVYAITPDGLSLLRDEYSLDAFS